MRAQMAFLTCIKDQKSEHAACRAFSLAYLKCRQDAKLMDDTPLATLGFRDSDTEKAKRAAVNSQDGVKNREHLVYPWHSLFV